MISLSELTEILIHNFSGKKCAIKKNSDPVTIHFPFLLTYDFLTIIKKLVEQAIINHFHK